MRRFRVRRGAGVAPCCRPFARGPPVRSSCLLLARRAARLDAAVAHATPDRETGDVRTEMGPLRISRAPSGGVGLIDLEMTDVLISEGALLQAKKGRPTRAGLLCRNVPSVSREVHDRVRVPGCQSPPRRQFTRR